MHTEQIKRILNGDPIAAAKLITDIENESRTAIEILQKLYSQTTGRAHVIGITGPGGVGKSTLIDGLIGSFLNKSLSIGTVAIDPSSPLSGGALLGDRVRLGTGRVDKRLFYRSVATRGYGGGLAKVAIAITHLFEAMDKNVALVETGGTGQSDIGIANLADTCVFVLMPEMGDHVQMMKGGVLELADIVVINKADMPGVENTVRQIERVFNVRHSHLNGWVPKVILTKAVEGEGIEELVDQIFKHKQFLDSSGLLAERRRQRAKFEVTQLVEAYIKKNVFDRLGDEKWEELIDRVSQRTVDPYSLALEIINL